jgi:hypothetical protein
VWQRSPAEREHANAKRSRVGGQEPISPSCRCVDAGEASSSRVGSAVARRSPGHGAARRAARSASSCRRTACGGCTPSRLTMAPRFSVDELVTFAYTATRFGGRRRWLTCIKCGRYCRKIYGGRYCRCRRCHRLKYASQSENSAQRPMQRADRSQTGFTICGRAPPRPSGSFRRSRRACAGSPTKRLLEQYDDLQERWAASLMARALGIRI